MSLNAKAEAIFQTQQNFRARFLGESGTLSGGKDEKPSSLGVRGVHEELQKLEAIMQAILENTGLLNDIA